MNAQELLKVCDEAEKTAPCDCELVEPRAPDFVHQTKCAAWQAVLSRGDALDELFELDFGSPARARQYAALLDALEDPATCTCTFYDLGELEPPPNCPRCLALKGNKAVLATEVKP